MGKFAGLSKRAEKVKQFFCHLQKSAKKKKCSCGTAWADSPLLGYNNLDLSHHKSNCKFRRLADAVTKCVEVKSESASVKYLPEQRLQIAVTGLQNPDKKWRCPICDCKGQHGYSCQITKL